VKKLQMIITFDTELEYGHSKNKSCLKCGNEFYIC